MADATQQVIDLYGGAVARLPAASTVRDQAKLRSAATDRLVWQAVFGSGDEREAARWLLWELGQATGARPASINDLYLARGRGECGGFTVPAINVRDDGLRHRAGHLPRRARRARPGPSSSRSPARRSPTPSSGRRSMSR